MGRVTVAVRVSEPANAFIAELAKTNDTTRAEVFRAMLWVASTHPDEVKAKIKQMKEAFA